MANAKKCDRCGKFYENNKKHETSGRIHGSKLTGISTTDTNTCSDKWFDLCDDCLTDLFEFLSGKELKD